jgi:hypothetical protein
MGGSTSAHRVARTPHDPSLADPRARKFLRAWFARKLHSPDATSWHIRRDFPRKEKNLVMANVGHPSPRSAIAGPRRVRTVGSDPKSPTPPSSKRLKAARVAAAGVRDLPGLDYDSEASARTRIAPPPKHLVEMTASDGLRPRSRSKRFRWFVLGVLLGALIVSAVRGDATTSFRAARAWGANQLRAMKKNPPVQLGPMSVATSLATPVPCDLTDEECATLLAPFAAANALPEQHDHQELASRPIPEVDVMSLKKVRPPVVYVAPPPKPAATVASEPPPEGDDVPAAPPSPASTSPAPIPADTGTPYAPRADMNGPLAVSPSPRVFIP